MSILAETFEKEMIARRLLPEGSSVVLAISGGVDSMVLLHLIQQLAPKYSWKLFVAHYNHHLRAEASEQDALFVQAAAASLGLRYSKGSGDVRAFARKSGQSIEMAARKFRHQFLASAAQEIRANHIALAHHANDQAELFLLRVLRGTMGEGLGGMKWQNASPVDSNIQLIRPLLGSRKQEIEKFAIDAKIKYRHDLSNELPEFRRNRVRHEVLPLLRAIEPDIENVLCRAAESMGEQSAALKSLACKWLESNSDQFDSQPAALQRTILHEQLLSAKIEPAFRLIENLRLHPRQTFTFSPGQLISREANGRLIAKAVAAYHFSAEQLRIQLTASGSTRFSGLTLDWKLLNHPRIEIPSNAENFDADRVGNLITLRHWQPGDRFQPIGFAKPAKLQDLFTAAKLDPIQKRNRVVATTETGFIFWVEGLRMGELFKLSATSEKGLRWSWGRRCD